MKNHLPRLAIAVPCYNEEEVLPQTIEKLTTLLNSLIESKQIAGNSFLFFVDDGSTDKTPEILRRAHLTLPSKLKTIRFTKNFGNQSAIFAGIKESYCRYQIDCVITIDADLQQDETKIPEFITKMNEGFEIVAGVKKTRGKEPRYKTIAAKTFYSLMNFLGAKIIPNHSEYRLLTSNAIGQLLHYSEKMLFLRSLIEELGLKTATVEFTVRNRTAGISKFNFAKLLKLAFTGIISHTIKPLHLILAAGLIVTLICFIILAVAVIMEFVLPGGLPNVHFFAVLNALLAAIQILCLGIIGQYIGQIVLEVKRRPLYLLDETSKHTSN